MEMCYDGALVMPSSYAIMDEEEMMYLEGGVGYEYRMRSKSGCLAKAMQIKDGGGYEKFNVLFMAAEIYAHALIYYDYGLALTIAKKAGASGFVGKIYSSVMNGISLENGPDKRKFGAIPYYMIFNSMYSLGPMFF